MWLDENNTFELKKILPNVVVEQNYIAVSEVLATRYYSESD
jgi:hypothetical protein